MAEQGTFCILYFDDIRAIPVTQFCFTAQKSHYPPGNHHAGHF